MHRAAHLSAIWITAAVAGNTGGGFVGTVARSGAVCGGRALAAGGCHAMPWTGGGRTVPGLVIEVLYVEHCPCVPAALSLVQRIAER
jgi:hypothetical protein